MKTKLAILAFLFLLLSFYASTAFAQEDSGGGSECPVSYSFKKNNGGGACKGDALLTVIINPMPLPGNIPMLTAIYYRGETVPNISPAKGYLVTRSGETNISYCITGLDARKNSFKNISSAG